MDTKTRRQNYQQIKAQLDNERSSFMPQWRECGDYILPRRTRFTVSDTNKGDRRNQKIIDSTATLSARTLRSGMMSGVTSPARPWFRLTISDHQLSETAAVKAWLYAVTQEMINVFLKSNLYNCLPTVYGDIGTFATSALYIEEDFKEVIRCYPFPIGSYRISNNQRMRVDVFDRDFRMTVRQLVEKFALRKKGEIIWDNFSGLVRGLWENGQTEQWIDVCHIIKPNEDYDPKKLDSRFKKYISCYYEAGTSSNTGDQNYWGSEGDKYLSTKGYDFFPVLCPRWEVTGEDAYGTECPGMQALGDIKALQLMHKRKAMAIEKMVNPPMIAPSSLKNQKSSILPGDVTYVDSRDQQSGFRPAHEVNPRIQELLLDIESHQGRIKKAFYEDLFLMLANSDRREITAREIDERHEEKLLALGPVLEQLNQDLLDPLIEITFNIMVAQGKIPEPPQELQGLELKVEYVSIMAQAQKSLGIGTVERFLSFVGQMAQTNPEVLDKVDADQAVDIYGDLTSVPPGLIRPDEQVEQIRQQRAQAMAQKQKLDSIQQGVSVAKDLSQADMEGDNALKRLVDQANAGQLTQ